MAAVSRVFPISGTCNNYPWGKKGPGSLAARLCQKSDKNFVIDDDKPYSEMWFGDYPDFPGRVAATGETLGETLKKNQLDLLGANVIRGLDAQLPFLPKVLSIAKALPLQIHPNKDLARELHEKWPDKFTDPNHKPEIAVALSEFEVFAGWKPLAEISPFFNIPPLRQFIPVGTTAWGPETLREVVRGLLKAKPETVSEIESDLMGLSGKALSDLHDQSYIVDLLPRLQSKNEPTDPGNIVALLCMNYLVLQPGEALFIPADGIHAYLSGDIIECMARSNNVLNSAFCPAAQRDNIDLFTKTLSFAALGKDDIMLPGVKSDAGLKGRTLVYRPPMREFDMLRIELRAGEDEELRGGQGPGVAIVTSGEGILTGDGKEYDAKEGYMFFVAPGTDVRWTANSKLQVYMAVV